MNPKTIAVKGWNRLGATPSRRILRDYAAHYWWGFILAIAFSCFSVIEEEIKGPNPSLFAFLLGPASFAWARQYGSNTVLRVLPISRKQLSRLYWFEGVWLFALPNLVLTLAAIGGAVMFGVVSGERQQGIIAFEASKLLIGLGYASVMMLLVSGLPTRGRDAHYWSSQLYGLCWGGLSGGGIFLMGWGAQLFRQHRGSLVGLAVACMLLLLLSYWSCERLVYKQEQARSSGKPGAPRYARNKGIFWFRFWGMQLVFALAAIAAILAMGIMMHVLTPRRDLLGMVRVTAISGMAISPMLSMIWFVSLRTLRCLPMTSPKMTLFLFSLPTVHLACLASILALISLSTGQPPLLYVLLGSPAAFGYGYFLTAAYTMAGQKYAPVVVALAFTAVFMGLMLMRPLLILFPILGFASIPLLWFMLSHSSALYRQPRLDGMR